MIRCCRCRMLHESFLFQLSDQRCIRRSRCDEENAFKIVALAHGADIFYCESPYLDCDAEKAYDRYHLKAGQAGVMARKAQVRELVVFHFSPRYTGQGEALEREAMEAFHANVEGGYV